MHKTEFIRIFIRFIHSPFRRGKNKNYGNIIPHKDPFVNSFGYENF